MTELPSDAHKILFARSYIAAVLPASGLLTVQPTFFAFEAVAQGLAMLKGIDAEQARQEAFALLPVRPANVVPFVKREAGNENSAN